MKEPNKFHICEIYETEKITHKASDAAEYRVVRFFHPRSSCTTHLMLFSERPLYTRRHARRSRVKEPNILGCTMELNASSALMGVSFAVADGQRKISVLCRCTVSTL